MRYCGIENDIILFIERSVIKLCKDYGIEPSLPAEVKTELEIPKEKSHGDLATNIALRIARFFGKSPLDVAALIKGEMVKELASSGLSDVISNIDAKPPGFINLTLSANYLYKVLLEIKRKKYNFGRNSLGNGLKVQIEFVSANPTGPLTIAHGRQAAIGDSLGNMLEFLGYKVVKEYYINDEGTQMNNLGKSVMARYLELCGAGGEFPEDGYKGQYVIDIARAFKAKFKKKFVNKRDPGHFREFALRWIMNDIKKDLKDFGVKFDVWYSQKTLRKSGKIARAMRLLKDKGYIYESEGAVWFKSTAFGDDKDRVVFKSDGSTTYLAPDIAYHLDKYRRGFKNIIDIWGPDHHGYVSRLKASVKALGYQGDSLSVLIVQLATLYRGGEIVKMSTRAGEFVTLREVIDEVGKDVARFCFIMRRVSSHLDFDLDVVKRESGDNPVYYIQYAHARIWSILEYSRKIKTRAKFDSRLLKEEEELELLRGLRQFPLTVALSARSHEPYMVLQYLQDLAKTFHSFYNKHRVVAQDPELTTARLVLVDCVKTVLANGLRLLGVSLPKKM